MHVKGGVRTLLLSVAILIAGIIHLGVSIGIIAKYKGFGGIYEQEIGLAGYNIVIGLFAIAVGIFGIIGAIKDHASFTKIVAMLSFVLGIFVLASLITALALSGQAATYLHDSMTNNMNNYISSQDALNTMNALQTSYQCCGVSLWLDWTRVPLTAFGLTNGRRRRRQQESSTTPEPEPEPEPESILIRSIRQINSGYIYNLPSDYKVVLPISCCQNGGTSSGGNSLGGYCLFSSANGTNSFYIDGCLEPVSNRAFSQLAGFVVINTCLLILSFVNFGKLVTVFKKETKAENDMKQKSDPNQVQNYGQQYSDNSYYMNGYNQYPSDNYNYPNINYPYNYQYSNEGYANPSTQYL